MADITRDEIRQIIREELTHALVQENASANINPNDIIDTKLRVQNIEKGIAQIVQYLRSQGGSPKKDDSYHGV